MLFFSSLKIVLHFYKYLCQSGQNFQQWYLSGCFQVLGTFSNNWKRSMHQNQSSFVKSNVRVQVLEKQL